MLWALIVAEARSNPLRCMCWRIEGIEVHFCAALGSARSASLRTWMHPDLAVVHCARELDSEFVLVI